MVITDEGNLRMHVRDLQYPERADELLTRDPVAEDFTYDAKITAWFAAQAGAKVTLYIPDEDALRPPKYQMTGKVLKIHCLAPPGFT